jgi:hypothetical protein
MPTAREIIMAAWFGPIVDPDYEAACDRRVPELSPAAAAVRNVPNEEEAEPVRAIFALFEYGVGELPRPGKRQLMAISVDVLEPSQNCAG